MKRWLCYWELHVADQTFPVFVVVEADDADDALNQLESKHGEGYHLQVKGCVGEATLENVNTYLDKDEVQ